MKLKENKCFKFQREIKGKSYSGYENGMPWFCCGLCLRKQEKGMFKNYE